MTDLEFINSMENSNPAERKMLVFEHFNGSGLGFSEFRNNYFFVTEDDCEFI